MKHFVLVALGGALGAVARWQLGALILHHAQTLRFPVGTFIINVLGCLVAGVLAGLVTRHEYFSADTRIFLFTGLLGGFTTFSAFGLETATLVRRGDFAVAGIYVLASIIAGLGAVLSGMKVSG